MIENRIRLVIIGALHVGGPMSGEQLSEASGIGAGYLYPALFTMEDQGLVTGEWENGPAPRRRIFGLRPRHTRPAS
ncbi:PadR family transcriptional regulator [Methylobacterium sp. ID0610]|uniref:PadR family transcriptional regulator n=1 Tax=Methylobacterium carpenticola TaxID=3344827 RepID=UPI00367E62F5